jgi:hypothetical protein
MTEKEILSVIERGKEFAHDAWLTANRELSHYNEHGDLNDLDTCVTHERIEAAAWSKYATLRELANLIEFGGN